MIKRLKILKSHTENSKIYDINILYNDNKRIEPKYLCKGFNTLNDYIGPDLTEIILNFLDYDENRDIKYCNNNQCDEILYKNSIHYYCNICYTNMIRNGIIFCNKCKIPYYLCIHELINKCKCYNDRCICNYQ